MNIISLVWRICIGYPLKLIMAILYPLTLAIPIIGGILGSIMMSITVALYDPFG